MRKITLLMLLLNFTNLNAQNKKELEEKIILIEQENKSLKESLTNTLNSLNLITAKSNEIEKNEFNQRSVILNLKKTNDSLMQIIKNESIVIETLKTEQDSIIKLFKSYYGSKKWEERLEYVIGASKIASIMSEKYKDNYSSSVIKKENIFIKGSNFKINQIFNVIINDEFNFYCKKTLNGYKIDWLASKGYNKTSLKAFEVNQDIKSEEFRIKATLNNSYYYNYRNLKDTFWNVAITSENDYIGTCYISKSSEVGKKIYRILNDGKDHNIIIELKKDINDGKCYLIEKIVSENWSKD